MPSKPDQTIRWWWVTASEKNQRPWHWREFFKNSEIGWGWGGPNWINSTTSFIRIKEMQEGDIIVAYQAGEGVVGFAYLDSDGYQNATSGHYDTFDLKSTPKVWFNQSIVLSDIYKVPNAKTHIEFIRLLRGTVFRIDPFGFEKILALAKKANPHQCDEIGSFFSVEYPIRGAKPGIVDKDNELTSPDRVTFSIQRVIRDSEISKKLKRSYKYKCQICNETIEMPDGKRYAEVHHLRPLGKPHNGKDGHPNSIIVCPQHHAMFDLGAIAIEPQTLTIRHWNHELKIEGKRLKLNPDHQLKKGISKISLSKNFQGGGEINHRLSEWLSTTTQ